MNFAFFGSSKFSVLVLEELKRHGLAPLLIVTVPDKPKGRKLVLSANPAKEYALENRIEFVEFNSLKDRDKNINRPDPVLFLGENEWNFFLVASYGKIIPPSIFNIPKHKTLNIHPSFLPKYRGASPIVSQILNDEGEIGTSIMVVDAGMDTGPVVAQKKIEIDKGDWDTPPPNPLPKGEGEGEGIKWPFSAPELEKVMARESVDLFVKVIHKWLKGEIKARPQDGTQATICGKIKKEDGLLDLGDNPRMNLLKIKAFAEWPRAYFFAKRGGKEVRVIVTAATLDESGGLKILRVVPEGRHEMLYGDFLRGNKST